MCDDALCNAISSEKWQTFENDVLTIDITNGIPLVSKFLVAITSGKVIGSHPISILICGYEKVPLASTALTFQ